MLRTFVQYRHNTHFGQSYAVDAIAGLAFGTDVNTLESDDDVIQRHLDKIFPKLFTRIVSAIPY